MTRGSRTRHHIQCGGPGGGVLSAYQVGGHVQDSHGDLLLVVIRLPSLVVLDECLSARVSVRSFVNIRLEILTIAQCAGICVLLVQNIVIWFFPSQLC